MGTWPCVQKYQYRHKRAYPDYGGKDGEWRKILRNEHPRAWVHIGGHQRHCYSHKSGKILSLTHNVSEIVTIF